MDEIAFRKYLKQAGKQPHVIDGLVKQCQRFEAWLDETHGLAIETAQPEHIQEYAAFLDASQPGQGRTQVRGLGLYYRSSGRSELAEAANAVRETGIAHTRRAFRLDEFMGVDQQDIARLRAFGITNVEQMRAAGKTATDRRRLSEQSEVRPETILELVKLSDLARIPGVKATRARLYLDSGLDTLDKIAAMQPDALRAHLQKYVAESGFPGIAPLPKEALHTIETARTLPREIEFE
jgi:hypothetical protein